jgi:hypothetical protein
MDVQVRLDGTVLQTDDRPSVSIGTHLLEGQLGPGCRDDNPTECLTTSREVTVVTGVGPQKLGIALPTPSEVALSFEPALPDDAQVRLDDGAWMSPRAATVRGGAPTAIAARVGRCPGSTCREGSVEVTPPLSPDGPVLAALTLSAPAARTAPPAASEGRLVTIRDLARFLETNPRFQREAMRATDQVPELYLKGWTGTTPPPGEPAQGVAKNANPILAKAVCAARGGLYPADKPPLSWEYDQRTKTMAEFRLQAGAVVLLEDNGSVYSSDGLNASSGFGIRCVR